MSALWLGFLLAAAGGVAGARILRRRGLLLMVAGIVPVALAVWWVSAADSTGREPVEPYIRTGWSLALVVGWELGLVLASLVLRARDDDVKWDHA